MINDITKKAIINYVKNQDFNRANTSQFLLDCRTYIENNNLQTTYPILYFYSNWSVHSSLDRNPMLFPIFVDIMKNLSGTSPELRHNLGPNLLIGTLIKNLVEFIGEFTSEVNTVVLDPIVIVNAIFNNLIGRELSLTPGTKNHNLLMQEIDKLPKGALCVSSLLITDWYKGSFVMKMNVDPYTFTRRGEADKHTTLRNSFNITMEQNADGTFRIIYGGLKQEEMAEYFATK